MTYDIAAREMLAEALDFAGLRASATRTRDGEHTFAIHVAPALRAIEKALQSAEEVPAKSQGHEEDGWRPIETAPRDGTAVLLWTDTRASVDLSFYLETGGEHFSEVQIGHWEVAIDAPMLKRPAGWQCERLGAPTHWRPLPPAPEMGR